MNDSIYAAEDEVDVWRDKINKDIQGMTPSEINEYFRRLVEPVMRQYHFDKKEQL